MKKAFSKKNPEILFWLGALVLSAVCFFLFLRFDLSKELIEIFSRFRLIHFAVLLLAYYLLFQLHEKSGIFFGLLLTTLVFVLPIAINLSAGLSNATIIGGFIPYKDGYYYYNGANMLLSGLPISQSGLQGAFRPLFPGLISILLMLTNENLLIAMQLMVLALGFTCFFAAFLVKEEYGPLPAALFFSLVYAFIRPMIGDTLTEIPSLTFACLAFMLLFRTARSKSFPDAVMGGIMLVLALSIRAGAFFILPLLILWLGWLFRGEKKISFKMLVVFSVIFLAAFIIFNMVFPRMVTAQGDSTFGNFSWMLYGQAVGGAGWDYHLEVLGTHDSAIVMQEPALERIRQYPLGLLIGIYKSYRDFFTNNSLGMFDLLSGEKAVESWIFWVLMIALMVLGLLKSAHNIKKPFKGLLLACFIGTILSIPFLPPIDGGNRFYSGSVPFLFAFMVLGVPALWLVKTGESETRLMGSFTKISRIMSILLVLFITIGPVLTMNLARPPAIGTGTCAAGQTPAVVRYTRGAYVDILPDGSTSRGLSPSLCLEDFRNNGADQTTDDFFNELVALNDEESSGMRLWAGVDWISRQYYFILLPLDLAESTLTGQTFQVCVQEIHTQFQQILLIRSID